MQPARYCFHSRWMYSFNGPRMAAVCEAQELLAGSWPGMGSQMVHRLVLLLMVALPLSAAGEVSPPKAGQVLTLTFSGLPPTLCAMQTGAGGAPAMTIRIPDNYNTKDNFPVFVFLGEANGGPGTSIGRPLKIMGPRDFVLVNMPLFKRKVDKQEKFGGLLPGMDDLPVVSHAYRTMLEKLDETIPNTDYSRSVIGGFSNGANELALLLSAQDKTVLTHFRNYFFVEGGIGYGLWLAMFRSSFKGTRFLVLVGTAKGDTWRRKIALAESETMREVAEQLGLQLKRVLMENIGHAFPEKYEPVVKQWAQPAEGPKSGLSP